MATPSLRDEMQRLRDAIGGVSDARLKTHMLEALEAFQRDNAGTDASAQTTTAAVSSGGDDKNDAIVVALRTNDVTTKAPRDALFLAVHVILQETGFEVQNVAASGDAMPLPANWDEHSANGLFAASYKHKNDSTVTFNLQGLFVGNKFEVYLSDDKNHTHSIEVDVGTFVSLSSSSSNAADLLRDLAVLRKKLTPFFENVVPKAQPQAEARTISSPPPRSPAPGFNSGGGGHSPYVIPPVGSGDILPPGLGGGDPSTQVGPDHPMFGRRYDPTRGPIPGARFDPFGPFSTDPQGPPRGFIGGPPHPMRPGPAPGMPFGDPNPDHLRMPRDDDMMDDPFGPRGGRHPAPGFPQPRGGGGFGFDGQPPFGSGNSFF